MGYTPYLIANYATGIEKRLQPWLNPDDSQEELLDGYVYRGTMSKRQGYNYFAYGLKGGAPYTESRIVNNIPAEQARQSGSVVVGNGTPGPYVFTLQNLPIRRGTTIITAGAQTATDNGVGGFVTNPVGGSGTINYTTGAVSITFLNNVAGAASILIDYEYHPGLPVMGIMNFVTDLNTKDLIVADTKFINRYNSSTNRLEYIGRTTPITGITQANPGVVTSVGSDLLTGDRVFISGVVGMNQVNNMEFTVTRINANSFSIGVDTTGFTAYVSGGTVALIYSGSKSNFWSWVNYKNAAGDPRLIFTNNKDEVQYYDPALTPSVGDYVNYPTSGAPQFKMVDDSGSPIISLLSLFAVEFKDRLILLRTTENGVVKPQRLRISGRGQNSDNFLITAIGAGKIDIPDGTWIMGVAFNRDDMIIFTEEATWALKYTGNDADPFDLVRLDESRGSDAPFGCITYLNRTSAASKRGLIISDGYRVERQDESIPDFTFNEVDNDNFNLCFAGTVDADRDHYLIYPIPGQPTNDIRSRRILTTNYDEDNYAVYRLPLSCMGTYLTSTGITWDDLLIYPDWASFAAVYGDWNSFAFSSGVPFSVGGGHFGEIWQLNVTEVEDNPIRIRNIVAIDSNTLEITTDFNTYAVNNVDDSLGNDQVFLTAVSGMEEVNYQQYSVSSIITPHYVFRVNVQNANASLFTPYTTGGIIQRVIPFSSTFKKFNPYVNSDQKVRCGWLYMYVDSTGTNLRRNIAISDITQDTTCVVTTVLNHNLHTNDQIFIFGVGGMTEVNNQSYIITVLSQTTFALNGINSSGYGAYTSGGYAAVAEPAKMIIDIIVNDNNEATQVNSVIQPPYQGCCTNLVFETGSKKWYKVYINQTGRFIQFRLRNQQAGAKINIQATMPGFQAVGRLI